MNKINKILIVSVLALGLLQVMLGSFRSTDGREVSRIRNRVDELVQQNQLLRDEIYSLTSLDKVEAFAKEQSLKPAAISSLTGIVVAAKLTN